MEVKAEKRTLGERTSDYQGFLILDLSYKLWTRTCGREGNVVLRMLPGFGLPSFELLFLAILSLCEPNSVHNGYPSGCWFGAPMGKVGTSCRVEDGLAFSEGAD